MNENERVSQVIEIMESLDLMHSGKTAYGEAASIIKRQQVEIEQLGFELRWLTRDCKSMDQCGCTWVIDPGIEVVIKQSTPASIEFKIKEKVKP
jgi:hypothetical protein